MDRIEIRLAQPTPLLNQIKGMNRFVYRKLRKSLAWEIADQLRKVGWRRTLGPIDPCTIYVERYCSGRPDQFDGLPGGFKPVLDVLQPFHPKIRPNGLGVIVDDRKPNLMDFKIVPKKAPPGMGSTRIIIQRFTAQSERVL